MGMRWPLGSEPPPPSPLFLLPHLRIHSRQWERASALQPHLLHCSSSVGGWCVPGGVGKRVAWLLGQPSPAQGLLYRHQQDVVGRAL